MKRSRRREETLFADPRGDNISMVSFRSTLLRQRLCTPIHAEVEGTAPCTQEKGGQNGHAEEGGQGRLGLRGVSIADFRGCVFLRSSSLESSAATPHTPGSRGTNPLRMKAATESTSEEPRL